MKYMSFTFSVKVLRRICWKHGILLKINSATDTLIVICRKFSEQIYLRMAPDRYFLCWRSQEKISIVNLEVILIVLAYFFRLFCTALGYHRCFFVSLALSDQCLLSSADGSFCLILAAPCSRFSSFNVLSACHWSVTQPTLLFKIFV